MNARELIEQANAAGKWFDILTSIGVGAQFLKSKNGPCPMCGGKDRFRWTNKNNSGDFFCSHCGPGYGFEFVRRFCRVETKEAAEIIERYIGDARSRIVEPVRVSRSDLNKMWMAAKPISADDPVGVYLKSRGVYCPKSLCDLRALVSRTSATMLALVRGPNGKAATIHRTRVSLEGKKLERKFMPGPVIPGVAVRLQPIVDGVVGIAEGIETAIAASSLHNMPCWSVLNEGLMQKWWPPPETNVVIFGDNDLNFVGQRAAYATACKLALKNIVTEVRLPNRAGDDWNDVLLLNHGGQILGPGSTNES